MLSRLLTPIFRISFGIVGIFLSLLMVAFMIGLLPNRETLELDARGNFAEALALQLSSAASNHDTRTLSQTMDAVVARNDELLSIAIRRNDGVLLLLAGDHDQHWKAPEENRSNPTHVQVALSDGKRVWGRIEMAFTPLPSSAKILGVPESLTDLLVFLGCMGFAGSFLVLKRALKELDPGSVIPDRVQSAFNSLAEGILILDERGIILLANDAFAETIGKNQKALFGTEVSELSWRQSGSGGRVNDYPWQVAVDSRLEVTGARLSYRINEDEIRNFVVNATCIGGADGHVSGIIATFDDVTELEQKNDDLEAAVRQLRQSEEEISKQNRDLQYLASHDPLTGCLNRRAFFEQFTILLEEAHRDSRMLTCMMADLDHFKSVNDTYGHAVGDQVIIGMANVLKKACGDVGLVGRYGGEEFCLVLPDLDLEQSRVAAEQIREAVYRQSGAWLQIADRHVTSSIGIAMRPSNRSEVGEIVDWADQALYQAKETGRNKVIVWQAGGQQLEQSAAGKMQEKAAPDQVPAGEKEGASIAKDAPLPEQASQLPAAATAGLGDTPQMAGLPSELIFKDRVEQAIARADWDDKIVALLEVRLEQVEQIGTLYGEALLSDFVTIVASRFKSALKRGDTISTLDGSKRIPSLCLGSNGTFFVEISDLEETNTVVWIVKRLIDSLAAPVTIHNDVIYADTHIGISLYPGDGSDVEGLMRSARTARQYAEKMEGKNNYQFFSEDMNRSSRRQMSMEASIRQALDKDLFALHYQPIIDIATGRVNAMEALLRSEHSAFSGVPIGSLIAVAEQTGLIIPIGEWVLRAAIQQIHRWQREGVDVPRISINLSAIQLSNKAAMVRIIKILAEMPISASLIQVEVTETAMLRDSEAAAQCLEQIRELGILIALDDFGTGQSSLAYLRRFQPDILKIDRCFIGEITASQSDETLVSAIVTMAQRLDIEVVAEGVETKKQAQKLNDIGCDSLQGFYFSRPMPAEKASHWLREHVGVDLIEEGGLSFEPSNQVA